MTPAELREQAAQIAREAHAASARGEDRSAFVLSAQAYFLEALATEMEARAMKTLPPVSNRAIVDEPVFTAEHKVAMSLAKAPKDRLAKAARAKKLSLADVARHAKIHPTLMTLARDGRRPMPRAAAEAIAALIGVPVDFWPRLS